MFEEALVVAAGGDRAIRKLDVGHAPWPRPSRMADADTPRRAVFLRPRARARRPRGRSGRAGCRLRGRWSPRGRPRIPCRCRRSRFPCRPAAAVSSSHPIPPHAIRSAPTRRGQHGGIGQAAAARASSPTTRRSTPDVMSKSPPLSAWHRSAYCSSAAVSASTRDGLATGGAVDARGDRVVAIARVLGLDALHVGDGEVRRAARRRVVRGSELQLVFRGHRAKREAE